MKKYNKALAMLTASMLAITPMAAAGMTVFAASITVNKVTDDGTDRKYVAYPLITGTLAEDGQTLTAMQWNTNIVRSNLETALKKLDSTAFSAFSGTTTTPADFATMANNYVNDDDTKAQNLAKIFNDTSILPTTVGIELEKAGDTYTKTGLTDGWYLIKDESTLNKNGNVFSANILEVRGDTPAITPKFSLPTLTKKIVEGEDRVDCNTAAIGDVITYEITTKVPNMTGYNKYFFIVNDKLSPGLTYNPDSINISIEGVSGNLTKDANEDYTDYATDNADYYVKSSEYSIEDGTEIKIVFENFLENMKNKGVTAGKDVTITYTATLNKEANIVSTGENAGNPNTANLVYSNNPNHSYKGITDEDSTTPDYPDEPNPGTPDDPNNPTDVVGETPEDKVNTYTTAIRIKKVDQDGQPFNKDVEFTLRGAKLNKVQKVSGVTFAEDAAGTYWKLKTGTYTDVAPTTSGLSEAAKDKYANDGKKYKKVAAAGSELTATGSPLEIKSTVDAEGYITFYGLNAGEYELEETKHPNGYNKAETISFTIKAENVSENSCTWTKTGDEIGDYENDTHLFPITVINKKGATLPTTGGIGTKLFYIIGGLLVSGSLVLLITKKRMGAKEN
ncbi:isopeptide-forming domain-containing fimbrial protein [Ruminococcus flavefaciens]|uniref:isopeptide-forming domain-containing fimbrial protein n=1 Tax=Ruminococcus flavefaciens TaxID=1265 RepID=UPI0026EFDFC2|nr:isopeptide-forming domain-containing fimbrial protein [Ruminococcus flavefaciens]MDD7516205.1 isopeptide-forming domain-containing fimbrial protein [Ruminococcus flavefaciens]MDY5692453.1 isopeptide-forming domain-containing fimbrial protein [Ruminococcus flavefaciens]